MLKTFINRLLTMVIVLMLVGLLSCASAAKMPEDSIMNVRITRPGAVAQLEFSADCIYLIANSDAELAAGTVINVFVKDGSIYVEADGQQITTGTDIELVRKGSGTQGIVFSKPNFGQVYCGDLKLILSGDVITPILKIDVEDYLYGIVGEQMKQGSAVESLKAQAIASRSYALRKKMNAKGAAYDITDAAEDQQFNGCDTTRVDVINAVDATKGRVIVENGVIALGYSTESNGGQTESAFNVWGTKLSYTEVKEDSYDIESKSSEVREAVISKDGSDLDRRLRNALVDAMAEKLEGWGLSSSVNDVVISSIDAITPADPEFEGSLLYRKLTFELSVRSVNTSTGKPVSCNVEVEVPTYGAIETWYALSINNADNETIAVDRDENTYTVIFRRKGHGVGLSRNGAEVMASMYNRNCDEILDFYYPGTSIEKIGTEKNTANVQTSAVERSVSEQYALPTLVPKATIEPTPVPTPTPKPTMKPTATPAPTPVWAESSSTAVETEPSRSVPPLFANISSEQTDVPLQTATPIPTSTSPTYTIFGPNGTAGVFDWNTGAVLDPEQASSQQNTSGSTQQIPDFTSSFGNSEDSTVSNSPTSIPSIKEDTVKEEPAVEAMKQPASETYGKVTLKYSSTLTLRAEANTESQAIGYLHNGEPVQVLAYNSTWLYVKTYTGRCGYASRAYMVPISKEEAYAIVQNLVAAAVTPTPEPEMVANPTSVPDPVPEQETDTFENFDSQTVDAVVCDFYAQTTADVRLHQSPEITSVTIITVPKGRTVHVLAYNGEWAYVSFEDLVVGSSVQGFIYRQYLKKV